MASSSFTCLDYYCITNEPTEFDARLPGTNVLFINLTLADSHIRDRRICRALQTRLLSRLREIVDKDKTQDTASRIDAVRVDVTEQLSSKLWAAMKGLNPKHLALFAGLSEECNFEPIKRMTTWNRLESLYFADICSSEITYRIPPFILRTLKSLELDNCMSLDLRGVAGSVPRMTIENLTIDTNDVGTSARTLLTNFPSIKQSLRHITLYTLGCAYDRNRERTGIRRILQECTGLTDVKISLRPHHAVQIAKFLPPSVQRVEFIAERTMASLALIDDWIARASDPTWAPSLAYLKFDFDREHEPWPSRFSQTIIRGDEDEESNDNAALEEELPPSSAQQDFEDSFDISGLPMGFDADPDEVPDANASSDEDEDNGEETPAVDLDTLPGVGRHPNHDGRRSTDTDDDHSEPQIRLEPVVSDEALAEFEAKLFEEKKVLFDALRKLRPSVELV